MAEVHATCVAVSGIGFLLRGASGSGKSDLALRLIDGGAVLVADDRVSLALRDGAVVAGAPAAIAGLLEVRGLGPLPVPTAPVATVRCVVDLVPAATVERLPDPRYCAYLGVTLPLVALDPFQASAPAKVRLLAGALRSAVEGWPVALARR